MVAELFDLTLIAKFGVSFEKLAFFFMKTATNYASLAHFHKIWQKHRFKNR